jgi:hypothetical protein
VSCLIDRGRRRYRYRHGSSYAPESGYFARCQRHKAVASPSRERTNRARNRFTGLDGASARNGRDFPPVHDRQGRPRRPPRRTCPSLSSSSQRPELPSNGSSPPFNGHKSSNERQWADSSAESPTECPSSSPSSRCGSSATPRETSTTVASRSGSACSSSAQPPSPTLSANNRNPLTGRRRSLAQGVCSAGSQLTGLRPLRPRGRASRCSSS